MGEERRHPQVVNIAEVEGRPMEAGSKMGSTVKILGYATGGKGTGCAYYEVQPGKAAFPYHFHCLVEEAIFVLEGEGTLRLGEATVSLHAGDYVTFPVGPQSAHQLRNTSDAILRYLCFSSSNTADIVVYPDSKKVGAMAAGSAAEIMQGRPWVRILTHENSNVSYYEGEDVGDK
jgi:uncharacterized cupin superfamily protein